MNKFGVVLGVAAVATLAGCKDPGYRRSGSMVVKNEVKRIDTTSSVAPAPTPSAYTPTTVVVEPVVPKCTCPPGTKHAKPCTCGAPDCRCVVATTPVAVADLSAKTPAEPEYTVYVVQNGDYLAKISKKFNVTIASVKRLNPSIKNDLIFVGQKLKLPGKVDVGQQAAVETVANKPAAGRSFVPFTGATKEYVVKSGDTLGSIAYGNGINIRQLKEINGLSSDSLKIGQKLKIPAEKVARAAKVAVPAAKKAPVAEVKPVAAAVAAKPAENATAPAAEVKPVAAESATAEAPVADAAVAVAEPTSAAEPSPAAPEKAESAATTTYLVQEGDDITGVSIRWGVSAAEIRELNNLADGDQLTPGQVIKLPSDAQQ